MPPILVLSPKIGGLSVRFLTLSALALRPSGATISKTASSEKIGCGVTCWPASACGSSCCSAAAQLGEPRADRGGGRGAASSATERLRHRRCIEAGDEIGQALALDQDM